MFQRAQAWPELPSDFDCPAKSWDTDNADWISAFNEKILANRRLFIDPRWADMKKTDPESFVDAVKVRKKNTGESIF